MEEKFDIDDLSDCTFFDEEFWFNQLTEYNAENEELILKDNKN